MYNIIFICHGNICRSPAAEFIFKKLIKERGIASEFNVSSLAVSLEEIGNDIYPPMKEALRKAGVPYEKHSARRISQSDYDNASFIFYMDESNKDILSFHIKDINHKVYPINIFTKDIPYIEDPWYTDRFDYVVKCIERCSSDILDNFNKLLEL